MGSRILVIVCDGIAKLRKAPCSMGSYPAELRQIEGVANRGGSKERVAYSFQTRSFKRLIMMDLYEP
jgi:hypothetical protein